MRDTIQMRVAAPTTRPTTEIEIAERLRHTIKFRDESTPDSAKTPDGERVSQSSQNKFADNETQKRLFEEKKGRNMKTVNLKKNYNDDDGDNCDAVRVTDNESHKLHRNKYE